MKAVIPVGSREVYLNLSFRPRQSVCYGMTNRVVAKDGDEVKCKGYVLFADHDDVSWEELVKCWRVLQNKYDLGQVCFFKTRGDNRHWQVISPVILSLGEVCSVLYESKCDMAFVGMGLMKGSWTLRIFEKDDRLEFKEPVFVKAFSRPTKRKYSSSHLAFLKHYYGVAFLDGVDIVETELELHRFMTGNFEKRRLM